MPRVLSRSIAVFMIMLFGAWFIGCQSSYVRSAKIYMQQDDPENAKEVLIEGSMAAPNDAELFYILGKVHAQLEEWKEMNEAFSRADELSDQFDQDIDVTRKESWRQVFNRGVKPFNDENFGKALEYFNTANSILENDPETLKRIALCNLQLENDEEAEKYFKMALATDPDKPNLTTRINLLNMYNAQKRLDEVVKLADEILELNSNQPEASQLESRYIVDIITKKAIAFQVEGKKEEAIKAWDDAIAKNPENPDFFYNKALLLHTMEKWDEASDAYLKVLEITPDDNEARLNAAKALFTPLKWDKIIEVLEPWLFPAGDVKSIENPEPNIEAWNLLRVAYENKGSKQKADIVTQIILGLNAPESN
ncbi:tetratricopeptide repeat protein [bacterium]|nr:tetratricopeptide repeat protein [bacterium]